jgi:hypothetical protein
MTRAARPGKCVNSLQVIASTRCNLLDAALTAGFLLNTEAGEHPGQCTGFNLGTALELYGAGAYATEGVDLSSAYALYAACSGDQDGNAGQGPGNQE